MTKEEKRERRKELREEKKVAVLYKNSTESLVEVLEEHGYHIERMKELSGYYVFHFGKSSVINFWLKEVPGWRFGLWWNVNEEGGKKILKSDFFTQFEKDIDKFKPSRSTFKVKWNFEIDKGGKVVYWKDEENQFEEFFQYGLEKMLKFIVEHPYRAWARSSSSDGLQFEVPWTGFKCWFEYVKHLSRIRRTDRFRNWANRKLYRWIKKNVMWVYEDWGLYEYKYMSPKYEFYAPLSKNKEFGKRGCYNLFLNDAEIKEIIENKKYPEDWKWKKFARKCPELLKKFKRLEKKIDKLSNSSFICPFFYYPDVSDCILILGQKGFKEFKEGKVEL